MIDDKKLEQRDNLLALYFLCDELAWGYNLLVTRILSTYGCGFRSADSSKGEKGVTLSLVNRIDISFDSQINFLLRSIIFAGKSTSDKIFHTMSVMRDMIQTPRPRSAFPDASGLKKFPKFVRGFKEGLFDNFNATLELELQNYLEVFIYLRILRNNIKEFGRANFSLIMGRPTWEFILTKQNRADETLSYASIYTGEIQENMSLRIDLRYFESVFLVSVEMFEILLGLVENKSDLLDFPTSDEVTQLRERQKQTEALVASSNLYPCGYWTPDGVFHMGD